MNNPVMQVVQSGLGEIVSQACARAFATDDAGLLSQSDLDTMTREYHSLMWRIERAQRPGAGTGLKIGVGAVCLLLGFCVVYSLSEK